MKTAKEKLPVLQIMRGLAIILVLFRHAIAQVNTDVLLSQLFLAQNLSIKRVNIKLYTL